jgi:hypothetical protein
VLEHGRRWSPLSSKTDAHKAAAIVAAAGGKLLGRIRLQKLAYLLELVGLGEGFHFHHKHYGPYCEELALAVRDATLIGLLHEEEQAASWGGTYSVFTTQLTEADATRLELAQVAVANVTEQVRARLHDKVPCFSGSIQRDYTPGTGWRVWGLNGGRSTECDANTARGSSVYEPEVRAAIADIPPPDCAMGVTVTGDADSDRDRAL